MLGEPEPHIRSLRARERHRRVALSAVASGLAKAVSIVAALVSVPVALSYLGVDRYGLWMTITSLSLLLSFTGMGVGNGLLNAIAEADGKGDTRLAHRYVSTAFFMLTGLAVGLGLVCAQIFPWVPWPRVFNVISPQATAEAGASVAVFLGCTLIGLPLSTIQRIHFGYQAGFSHSLWHISGTILGLLGLLAAIQIEASLPRLVLSVAGGPLVATLFQTLVLFRGR